MQLVVLWNENHCDEKPVNHNQRKSSQQWRPNTATPQNPTRLQKGREGNSHKNIHSWDFKITVFWLRTEKNRGTLERGGSAGIPTPRTTCSAKSAFICQVFKSDLKAALFFAAWRRKQRSSEYFFIVLLLLSNAINKPTSCVERNLLLLLEERQKAREGPDSSGTPQMLFASRYRCVPYPQSPEETAAPLCWDASQCLSSRRREALFPRTGQAGVLRLTVSREHPSIAKLSLEATLVSWSPPG